MKHRSTTDFDTEALQKARKKRANRQRVVIPRLKSPSTGAYNAWSKLNPKRQDRVLFGRHLRMSSPVLPKRRPLRREHPPKLTAMPPGYFAQGEANKPMASRQRAYSRRLFYAKGIHHPKPEQFAKGIEVAE